MHDDVQAVERRGRSVIANDDVERRRDDVLVHKIRRGSLDPCRERPDNGRMTDSGMDEPLEISRELKSPFGRRTELEDLDRHELIPLDLMGAEDWSQGADADLMEDPKWPKRVRRRETGSFRLQRDDSSGR